jgi:hypothetical protein
MADISYQLNHAEGNMKLSELHQHIFNALLESAMNQNTTTMNAIMGLLRHMDAVIPVGAV